MALPGPLKSSWWSLIQITNILITFPIYGKASMVVKTILHSNLYQFNLFIMRNSRWKTKFLTSKNNIKELIKSEQQKGCLTRLNFQFSWLDPMVQIPLKTSRGWQASVLKIPAAALAAAIGEIRERENFKLKRPICNLGHSSWFHFSCADVIDRFTHSNDQCSIAWVGIIRTILIALLAHNPCQPCFSITSKKLPTMFLDPTPTTILVLNITHYKSEYFNALKYSYYKLVTITNISKCII